MSISLDIQDKSTDIQNSGSFKLSEDKFDPKIEADMKTILSMGYEEKMIRKVYIILKPSEINEASFRLLVSRRWYISPRLYGNPR